MKAQFIFTVLLLLILVCFESYAHEYISLWPEGKMPNSKGLELKHIEERQRVTQISKPGMYSFFLAEEEQNGAAVLILPPGGYQKLTYNLGGFQVAKWLNTHGITAFVLIYRLLNSPLPPMQIGQYGQLQEWIKDWDNPKDKHRHVSHLYGLHPSNQISPFKNPELFSAAQQTLKFRGDKSTGWSMGWKVNFWARLLNGDRAFDLIKTQLHLVEDGTEEDGTYPNLLNAHPPFEIDANLGCTAGISEMLLQSYDEAIHLLTELTASWEGGSIKGLKVRGGFELDLDWENKQFKSVIIQSELGGNCRIRTHTKLVNSSGEPLTEATGENTNPFFQNATITQPLNVSNQNAAQLNIGIYYVYDIVTKKGEILMLSALN